MKKHLSGVKIEKNALSVEENGVIRFINGLPITDSSKQKNGTSYDIESMDLSEFNYTVTIDHEGTVPSIVAKALGVVKSGTQVVLDALQFAVNESAVARLTHDLMAGGFVKDMSIETYGPMPDEEGIYRDAKLVGLSIVPVGNNNNATLSKIASNSIKQAKNDGLDTKEVEEMFPNVAVERQEGNINVTVNVTTPEPKKELDMKYVTVKNGRDFDITVKYKNASGEEVEQLLKPGSGLDVVEDQQESIENQIKAAQKPGEEFTQEGLQSFMGQFEYMLENAVKPLSEKIEEIEKNNFNKSAKEPEFKPTTNGIKDTNGEFAAMDWRERHAKQINSAWEGFKGGNMEAFTTLRKLNEYNLGELKKEGLVSNSLTLGDFGNFVISRELLTTIQGVRNNYSPLVDATNWRETLSTQMAWLNRSGDINMQSVEFCDDGANGNLKPISEYTATIRTADLEELAAVTPVCNAATRFLAADLLGDVAQGYRTDYDRKRAQLVIARLEQAVESNGKSVIYDTNPNVEALKSLLNAWKKIAQTTPNGVFVMNTTSYASILGYALSAGISGPLANLFTTGDQPRMFGRPYIVVSDDLMPSLDSAATVSIAVDGATVTVNHAVFYADLSNFTGRVSGGLQYDLSTEAAYEDSGTVKSAYQRNELVLRGSFFRGGAVLDNSQVAGILSPGVS